jgi:RNA polymerase sigma-70 factor, ECF subfamily
MKDPPPDGIHRPMEGALQAHVASEAKGPPRDLAWVHAEHAGFVWATLQRFGVQPSDLEDAFQDVFVVVQRRLPTFDWACAITTWLFALCRRVASTHRRRPHMKRERFGEDVGDVPDPRGGPEEITAAHQARTELERILDEMDLDRRVVFVMFQIDEIPCNEIAAIIGVPIGTVYSRLHAARTEFAALLQRSRARAARRGRP